MDENLNLHEDFCVNKFLNIIQSNVDDYDYQHKFASKEEFWNYVNSLMESFLTENETYLWGVLEYFINPDKAFNAACEIKEYNDIWDVIALMMKNRPDKLTEHFYDELHEKLFTIIKHTQAITQFEPKE